MAGGERGFKAMYGALLTVLEAREVAVVESAKNDVGGTLALVRAAVGWRWWTPASNP